MNGRNLLLTYDGYRCHMGLKVFDLLQKVGVLCYCLQARTRGTTQPLDVEFFGPFKLHLYNAIHQAFQRHKEVEFDLFDLLHVMRWVYEKEFVKRNILSAFAKYGMWPVCIDPLLSMQRPASLTDPHRMLDAKFLRELFDKKRNDAASGSCLQPVTGRRGYVNTSKGILLSGPEALEAARKQADVQRTRYLEKQTRIAAVELLEQSEKEEKHAARDEFVSKALAFRVREYGDPNVKPRTLSVRH